MAPTLTRATATEAGMPSCAVKATAPAACASASIARAAKRIGSGPPSTVQTSIRHGLRSASDGLATTGSRPSPIATVCQPDASCRSSASTRLADDVACAASNVVGAGCGTLSTCTPCPVSSVAVAGAAACGKEPGSANRSDTVGFSSLSLLESLSALGLASAAPWVASVWGFCGSARGGGAASSSVSSPEASAWSDGRPP